MAKVTFNGNTKEINIINGVSAIDAQLDLYSEWKNWILLSDNAKYPAAFRTFGGDPTIPGQVAPRYFFLINDWRIVASSVSVSISTNLYSDAIGSGLVINNSDVVVLNSDAVIVDTSGSTTSNESLDYGDRIYIDVNEVNSGQAHPYGTLGSPVNSITDALFVSNTYNIHNFYLLSDITITENLSGYNLLSDKFHPNLILDNNILNDCIIVNFSISGSISPISNGILIENSIINNLSNFGGDIINCGLNGNIDIIGDSNFMNCKSFNNTPSISKAIGITSSSITLNVESYNGELLIDNLDNINDVINMGFLSGKLTLSTNITQGNINIRGIASLIDNSSIDVIKNISALVPDTYIDAKILNIAQDTDELVTDVNYLVNKIDGQEILLKQIAGLSQKNYRISDQLYDINGLLTNSTIRTYATANDAQNEINEEFIYAMSATYDTAGRLVDYKVIEV